jgi:hypothetical protein
MASAGYSQRGRCCAYIRPAVVTCLEIRWSPGFWLADWLPLATASRGWAVDYAM